MITSYRGWTIEVQGSGSGPITVSYTAPGRAEPFRTTAPWQSPTEALARTQQTIDHLIDSPRPAATPARVA